MGHEARSRSTPHEIACCQDGSVAIAVEKAGLQFDDERGGERRNEIATNWEKRA
jgi:hypothetical protein